MEGNRSASRLFFVSIKKKHATWVLLPSMIKPRIPDQSQPAEFNFFFIYTKPEFPSGDALCDSRRTWSG
jgi:hypothetical protein